MLPPHELEYVNKALKNMKLKKLGDYYKTDRWKIVRRTMESIFEKCACCDKKPDTLHHKTYENLGNETQDDLIWLCSNCHEMLHAELDELLNGSQGYMTKALQLTRDFCNTMLK